MPAILRRLSFVLRQLGLIVATLALLVGTAAYHSASSRSTGASRSVLQEVVGPVITFSPVSGTSFTSPSQRVTVKSCENPKVVTSLDISVTGGTGQVTTGANPGCPYGLADYVDLTMTPGGNDIWVDSCDAQGACSSARGSFFYNLTVTSVSVSLSPLTINVGNTSQASATVTWSDNSTTSAAGHPNLSPALG